MTVKTLRDILVTNSTPTTWIVDGLLRTGRGRPSLLVGAPHAGKSTLAIQLAKAVSTGQPFLGRETVPSAVLFWSSEESLGDLAFEFEQDTNAVDPLFFIEAVPGKANTQTLYEGMQSKPEIRLCIVENLSSFFELRDVKDNSEIERVLGVFRETMAEFIDCCFVIIHWTRKSEGQGKTLVTNNVLGGTSIVGNADTIIGIQQVSDEDYRRVIQAKVRGQRRSGARSIVPTFLSFDPDSSTSVLDVTVEESKQAARIVIREGDRKKREDGLLFTIKNNPGLSQNALHDKFGGNMKNFLDLLDTLESSERIERRRNQGERKNETHVHAVISYEETVAARGGKL